MSSANAARVVVDLHTAREAVGYGSTAGKKAGARFAGAMQVWEALTGLTGDAALGHAYDTVQVLVLRDDEVARLRADAYACLRDGEHRSATRHRGRDCPAGRPNAAWGAVT